MRDEGSLDQGDGRGSSSDWSYSRYILQVESTIFADGLIEGHKKEK